MVHNGSTRPCCACKIIVERDTNKTKTFHVHIAHFSGFGGLSPSLAGFFFAGGRNGSNK